MGAIGAVIVAAGTGSRMNAAVKKQFLLIGDKPVFIHTLHAFEQVEELSEIVVVTGAEDIARCEQEIKQYGIHKVSKVVAGGSERQHSVRQGLQALSSEMEWVLVHDAARPFITPEQITHCCQEVQRLGAVVLAVPVKETVKVVNEDGFVESTPERKSLWMVQTPQAFQLPALLEAHDEAWGDGFVGTDDAMLMERKGVQVHVLAGQYDNIKITTPDDLLWAEYQWKQRVKRTDD